MSEKSYPKAKTLSDLLWENRLEWDKWLRLGVTEMKQSKLAPKYQSKWLPLAEYQKLEAENKQLDAAYDEAAQTANTLCLKILEAKKILKEFMEKWHLTKDPELLRLFVVLKC